MDSNSQAPAQSGPAPAAPTPKQQIVERVKSGKNVLVTVGNNPSVDELAAALGFTFMLGKLEKHVTSVFSGDIPPAMSFLDPESTFENSVDSLRDFIIALDKEKADKLRYKLEDDVVKIFITPYKTTLKKEDFTFSQGDLNVDVVVAIGVKKQEDLDKAITSHGRILHDAAVISINAGDKAGDLGAINWNDPAASSVSEMLVSISEAFGSGLLDEQISTAFLTGIVAETNRFSNEKTSPKVMTMSAQLMAAGANQQLIASNLRQEGMITEPIRKKEKHSKSDGGEMVLEHEKKSKKHADKPKDHRKPEAPEPKKEAKSESSPPALPPVTQPPLNLPPPPTPPKPPNPSHEAPLPSIKPEPVPAPTVQKPNFTGTLSATTAQAEETKAEEAAREAASNNIALEHKAPEEDAVEAARKAVEDAAANQPSEVTLPESAPQPVEPPLPAISHSFSQQPDTNVSAQQSAPTPEPSPVDAFMQPHAAATQPLTFSANENAAAPFAAGNNATSPTPVPSPSAPPPPPGMPPLPPLPDTPGMPPMPPLPGQPVDPAANFQPQINPGFIQDLPQSQNQWTDAANDLSAKRADQQANRQAKMDQMTAQYDQAVERNQQLKQQNNTPDHSTFPLPQ
jgi:hypothetical protein